MENNEGRALTLTLKSPPTVISGGCAAGKKESEGPLKGSFDQTFGDALCGEKSWEAAESRLLRDALNAAVRKARIPMTALDAVFSGDLVNQCAATTYALRECGVPFLGLYGACSTMAEGLVIASLLTDAGYLSRAAAAASSHFCTAERQFRMPLEYGGQRPPTSQWTVTGAGALILQREGAGPFVTHVTVGRIVDAGVCDANDMGAAMAPAAADTVAAHLRGTGRGVEDYDAIVTGDLGCRGHAVFAELLRQEGYTPDARCTDCGILIFDPKTQDVHSGGSGCGCSASVLAGHLLGKLQRGEWKRLLFAATGALISPATAMQGESIPGICHAVTIDTEGGRRA